MKTTFGSSSAVVVLEIRIPLYSASSEEKEEMQKQSVTKRNLFTTAYQRKGRARIQRLHSSFAYFLRA